VVWALSYGNKLIAIIIIYTIAQIIIEIIAHITDINDDQHIIIYFEIFF
jgi:hypothetical protein